MWVKLLDERSSRPRHRRHPSSSRQCIGIVPSRGEESGRMCVVLVVFKLLSFTNPHDSNPMYLDYFVE